MDAQSWVEYGIQANTTVWPLKLVDRGYDVWMGNNRGTRYSNINVKDNGQWSSEKERWNFTWAEYGKYDLPAFIDKILEVTEKPTLTYIGYSTGTSQMFYGLATMEAEYFGERLDRFIAVAPCIYNAFLDYDAAVANYKMFFDLGIYY